MDDWLANGLADSEGEELTDTDSILVIVITDVVDPIGDTLYIVVYETVIVLVCNADCDGEPLTVLEGKGDFDGLGTPEDVLETTADLEWVEDTVTLGDTRGLTVDDDEWLDDFVIRPVIELYTDFDEDAETDLDILGDPVDDNEPLLVILDDIDPLLDSLMADE
jgi:hypothetical protein